MAKILSKINPDSADFKARSSEMEGLVQELAQRLEEAGNQGEEKYRIRHRERGKLLARERIDRLLDTGTDFWELMPLAGFEQDKMTLGGSVIGGIGQVGGQMVMINASVPTLKGGALNLISVLKTQRLDVIAKENRLPCIYLTESAGADLFQQAQVYNVGGASFREISRRSKLGIPSITIVFGNCTAGGAYIPGMSDYVIMIRKQSKVFLAGPPLVRMATNEVVDDEVLGGADMHANLSGLADFIAEDEESALQTARELVGTLKLDGQRVLSKKAFNEPEYESGELLGILSSDYRRPVDPREIIARITDGSCFLEFKPSYGGTLVTGFAEIGGHPIGVIANQGVLVSEAANKGAQFIQLCEQDGRPILFLQNITGFMVGKKCEQEGIIKNGAKLINAVANMSVPAITILTGASYGAGNYAMCGRSFEPRFLFAWPNSRLAVMGAKQLVGVLETIKRETARKYGEPMEEEQLIELREAISDQVKMESDAYYATSRLWDDGIIDPRDTRKVLIAALNVVTKDRQPAKRQFGIFRM